MQVILSLNCCLSTCTFQKTVHGPLFVTIVTGSQKYQVTAQKGLSWAQLTTGMHHGGKYQPWQMPLSTVSSKLNSTVTSLAYSIARVSMYDILSFYGWCGFAHKL